MERQEKGGSTYFFLALVTLAFLAAVLYLTFGANRTEQEGYTVQTERAAAEEVAPVRVLVNINTATAEELETVTGIGPVLAQAILDYRAEHGDFQTLDELLEVRGIGKAGVFSDISFDVHAGEIVGFCGLVGAGRTEVARCLFGADGFTSGSFELDGVPYQPRDPLFALDQGLALVPEDRKKEGAVLGLSIRDNLSLSSLSSLLHWRWFVNTRKEDALIESYRQALQIKMVNSAQEVRKLSGGNQQKVILARCMALNPRVLIVDEPTRGIDVGTKSEVHQVLFDMAKKGVAVIVISSDLPEVMAVSDRIITLSEGRVTGEIHGDDANEERLMTMMAINHNALNAA